METLPLKCLNINTIASFCECLANAEPVDPAARAFCDQAKTAGNKNRSGDDLAELKKLSWIWKAGRNQLDFPCCEQRRYV